MRVIFEDHDVVVVTKPAGLPVFPLSTGIQDSLATQLAISHPELSSIGRPGESGIVHRLDNGTTGLVVAAKSQKSYGQLRDAWNTPAVTKTYVALVVGAIPESLKYIQRPIAHHPRKKNKMVVCRSESEKTQWKGRSAFTRFVSKEFYLDASGHALTLLRLTIETGARHQIRVHLAGEGHALAGDALYQNPKGAAREAVPGQGHFLHLERIHLDASVLGEKRDWHDELPENFMKALSELRGPYPASP